MAKQFKRHSIHTTKDNGSLQSAGVFTFPAEFTDKQIKKAVGAQLMRAEDSIFIGESVIVELR